MWPVARLLPSAGPGRSEVEARGAAARDARSKSEERAGNVCAFGYCRVFLKRGGEGEGGSRRRAKRERERKDLGEIRKKYVTASPRPQCVIVYTVE